MTSSGVGGAATQRRSYQTGRSSSDAVANGASAYYYVTSRLPLPAAASKIEQFRLRLTNKIGDLSLRQLHACAIGLLLSACAFVCLPSVIAALLLHHGDANTGTNSGDSWWLSRLLANLIGYGSVLLPLGCIVLLARVWDYENRAPRRAQQDCRGTGCLSWLIHLLAVGSGPQSDLEAELSKSAANRKAETATVQQQPQPHSREWYINLAACVIGLQAAYLTWGVLQERMVTADYGHGERFRDSQFLVFANRFLSGLLAVAAISLASRTPHRAPAFEYTWSSLSNVLSSWCQYEALLYVSFPTQVLAKACKIIPVMLMGKLVSRKSYRWDEYATAALISAGTSAFLLTSESDDRSSSTTSTTISGVALLAGYMAFDAFTSTWQSLLFTRHGVSTLQMMAGTSVLSCVLTVAAQLEQGSLPAALAFAYRHPLFLMHLGLLSVCSTVGQLVIFHTIARFGSVTFIIIMTVRQAFAILLSCLIYQHRVPPLGYLGVAVVFLGLFLRIYLGQRLRQPRTNRTG